MGPRALCPPPCHPARGLLRASPRGGPLNPPPPIKSLSQHQKLREPQAEIGGVNNNKHHKSLSLGCGCWSCSPLPHPPPAAGPQARAGGGGCRTPKLGWGGSPRGEGHLQGHPLGTPAGGCQAPEGDKPPQNKGRARGRVRLGLPPGKGGAPHPTAGGGGQAQPPVLGKGLGLASERRAAATRRGRHRSGGSPMPPAHPPPAAGPAEEAGSPPRGLPAEGGGGSWIPAGVREGYSLTTSVSIRLLPGLGEDMVAAAAPGAPGGLSAPPPPPTGDARHRGERGGAGLRAAGTPPHSPPLSPLSPPPPSSCGAAGVAARAPPPAPPRAPSAASPAPVVASAGASLWTPDVTRCDLTAPQRRDWSRRERRVGPACPAARWEL